MSAALQILILAGGVFFIAVVIAEPSSCAPQDRRERRFDNAERKCRQNSDGISVFIVSLGTSINRRAQISNHLTESGYLYSFVDAFSPANLSSFPANIADLRKRESRRNKILMSCTVSHLQAMYTAWSQRENEPPRYNSSNSSFAVILEDDVRFQFDIDWKGLIGSAPTDWTILQLVTCNDIAMRALFTNIWVERHSLWESRTRDVFWSTGAYVVNLDKLGVYFNNATDAERQDVNARFNLDKLFNRRCNRRDSSIAARLRCKGRINFIADKFIYHLGEPNTYIITVPVVTLVANASSTFGGTHDGQQAAVARLVETLTLNLTKSAIVPGCLGPLVGCTL